MAFQGGADYYKRVRIQCPHPHHNLGGKKCSKARNCGPAQTKHFGPMEPLAYLTSWMRKGEECATREDHMANKPDLDSVEETMRQEGWL